MGGLGIEGNSTKEDEIFREGKYIDWLGWLYSGHGLVGPITQFLELGSR